MSAPNWYGDFSGVSGNSSWMMVHGKNCFKHEYSYPVNYDYELLTMNQTKKHDNY
jgi:hypothetical protein